MGLRGGEVIIPCDGELTSAAFATVLALPRALAIATGTLPAFGYDCDGNCILDADGDGICDDEDECLPGTALMSDDNYKLIVEEYNVRRLLVPPTVST